MAAIDFERSITFPEKPFDAARIYLSVMAYPERGAGQPGGLGVPFIGSLWQYLVWKDRQLRGLNVMRERLGDRASPIPKKRDFEGALNRGLRRIERRVAAYDIVGNQLLSGTLNGIQRAQALVKAGEGDAAFARPLGDGKPNPIRREIIAAATPSPRGIVRRDLDRWSERFRLNETGRSADPSRKEKDVIRRGYRQSVPVLHMVHGLNIILDDIAPKLKGWNEVDWLLVLLGQADAWIWTALRHAITWREVARIPQAGLPLYDQMIELIAPEIGGIMHPAGTVPAAS